MNVAVNARFLDGRLEGLGYFTREILKCLSAQHPEHQFHILFDRAGQRHFLSGENVHSHTVGPAARHPLLWKYWFDYKIPPLLKKIKADVFLSPDGYCSLNTKVPQCVVVHDLGFLHYPGAYKRWHRWYYQYYAPKFLRKAAAIATVSEFTRNDISEHYKIAPENITVVYNGVRESFRPINFDEQALVKQQYTAGREYFVYVGAIHPRKNLVHLLKAFSIFKRRLKSEMKLVLAGRLAWHNEDFLQLLKTYKYKDDVVLTGYLEEHQLARLTASAYASVYPSLFEGFGVPVIEAMKCGVPVLTSANTSMQEIGEDAALYFNPLLVEDMADKLMLIYKDETLRNALILRGKAVAEKYTWQRTSHLLWQSMMKALV